MLMEHFVIKNMIKKKICSLQQIFQSQVSLFYRF